MPDRDDFEFALQENLKLRRELGTKVAKANDSSIPNESADFPRLGIIVNPLMIVRERLRRIGNAPYPLSVDRLRPAKLFPGQVRAALPEISSSCAITAVAGYAGFCLFLLPRHAVLLP